MKKYIVLAIASMFMLTLLSCSNDFLEHYPQDELSDGNFWKTPTDAEMFIGEVYRLLPGGDAGVIDGAINSDDAMHGIKWAKGSVSQGVYTPSSSAFSPYGGGGYADIRKCNVLIEKIELIPDYPAADKEIVIAEARFFRAYVYFNLIRTYGDVPYIDKSLTVEDLSEPIVRTPWKEVYAKVMEDFDFAISKLPSEWPASKYGKVTKWAALGFKAQAALYYGEADKMGSFSVAADAANQIIEGGLFDLFDKENTGKYKELFWEKQDNCEEVIFARVFDGSEDASHYIMGWGCYSGVGWGGINPTQSLVDAFEDSDGSPIASSKTYDPIKPFEKRDPRLEVNVIHHGETVWDLEGRGPVLMAPLPSSKKTAMIQGDGTATGYNNQKYCDQSLDINVADVWSGGKDWHLIRFAEILLTYAEAKNEVSPLDATAFAAVNRVRTRVGMPVLQRTDASLPTYCATQDDLRQRIRNEWRVEYAMEGNKRMWDVRRWGIAMKVLNEPFMGMKYTLATDNANYPAIDGDGGVAFIPYQMLTGAGMTAHELQDNNYGGYSEYNYIFPIPQYEINLNKDLTQNPGY